VQDSGFGFRRQGTRAWNVHAWIGGGLRYKPGSNSSRAWWPPSEHGLPRQPRSRGPWKPDAQDATVPAHHGTPIARWRGGVGVVGSPASRRWHPRGRRAVGVRTVTSRARRHPREAGGLDVLSNRGGNVLAPSGVLRTPHSRPPERPRRGPINIPLPSQRAAVEAGMRGCNFGARPKDPRVGRRDIKKEESAPPLNLCSTNPNECLRSAWWRRRRRVGDILGAEIRQRRLGRVVTRERPAGSTSSATERHGLCTLGRPPHPPLPPPPMRGPIDIPLPLPSKTAAVEAGIRGRHDFGARLNYPRVLGRRDRERPIKEKKSAPVNVYGRCGCVAVGLEGVSNRGGTVSAPAGVLRTP
jgi:hypothetical protein